MLVPFTPRLAPLLKLKLSSLSPVRLLTWAPPMSSVTAAVPLSITALVVLFGTPLDQLEALLQFPDAPPTQHVPPEGHVKVSGPVATEAERPDKREAARSLQPPLFSGKLGPVLPPRILDQGPFPPIIVNRSAIPENEVGMRQVRSLMLVARSGLRKVALAGLRDAPSTRLKADCLFRTSPGSWLHVGKKSRSFASLRMTFWGCRAELWPKTGEVVSPTAANTQRTGASKLLPSRFDVVVPIISSSLLHASRTSRI